MIRRLLLLLLVVAGVGLAVGVSPAPAAAQPLTYGNNACLEISADTMLLRITIYTAGAPYRTEVYDLYRSTGWTASYYAALSYYNDGPW